MATAGALRDPTTPRIQSTGGGAAIVVNDTGYAASLHGTAMMPPAWARAMASSARHLKLATFSGWSRPCWWSIRSSVPLAVLPARSCSPTFSQHNGGRSDRATKLWRSVMAHLSGGRPRPKGKEAVATARMSRDPTSCHLL
jgi:hypothetical protein